MKSRLLRVAIMAVLGSTVANAVSILVVNFSFENPALGAATGGFTSAAPPGWTANIGGAYGVFSPTLGELASPTDGVQVGYINAGSATTSLSQVLSSLLAVGAYTLRVDFFSRVDGFSAPWPGSEIDLMAGSTVLNSTVIGAGGLATGSVTTSTVSFTAAPGNPNLGQALQIRISNLATDGSSRQIDFDNVRLDGPGSTGVPEPGSFAFAAAGVGLVALLRRRTLARLQR